VLFGGGVVSDCDVDLDALVLEQIAKPSRVMAPFRTVGGKGLLAKRIFPYIPRGRLYVEPFCGAASVFWHLDPPFPVEVLNDLDGEIVNLFRVLQDREMFEEFKHRVIWTPYSRAEFERAISVGPDASPIDRAWAFFVRQNQGFGGMRVGATKGSWGRDLSATSRGMSECASQWRCRMKLLAWWHDRLTRVQIDCIDGIEAIKYWDTEDTVFYVDPPYVLDARSHGMRCYVHEMSLEDHERLVETLLGIKGLAVVSGYHHEVYKPLEEAGWKRYEFGVVSYVAGRTRASGMLGTGAAKARCPRIEVIWTNADKTLF